jgi:hypothetical protein
LTPTSLLARDGDAEETGPEYISLSTLLSTQPPIDKLALPEPLIEELAQVYNLTEAPSLLSAENKLVASSNSSIRNPVSVYNWLKRNKPDVFLQEGADKAAASTPTTATGSGRHLKRASVVTKTSEENAAMDADSVSTPLSAKGEMPTRAPAETTKQTNGTSKRKRRRSPSIEVDQEVVEDLAAPRSNRGSISGAAGTSAALAESKVTAGSVRKKKKLDIDDGSLISALVDKEREKERAARAERLAALGIGGPGSGRGGRGNPRRES